MPREASAEEALIGRLVGNYRLTSVLGFGSMGRVFLAEHSLMGRKAAIKILNHDLSERPEVVERFLNEARAVNDIRHPNVVEITDFGRCEGRYYLTMELLEGETLAGLLQEGGPLLPDQAVRVGVQVASALQAAHQAGVVHRDLKPENIFLAEHADYPLYVKLLDFGVAKLLAAEERGYSTKRTELGALLGTPHYMSPEQCLGDVEVGPASDIYALGVVLYEMVTGRLPFEAQNLSRLLLAHIQEAVTPPSSVCEVPGFLEALILRALSKRPADRYPDMQALRAALLRKPAPSRRPGALAAPVVPIAAPVVPVATPLPRPIPVALPVSPAAATQLPPGRPTRGLAAAATLAAARQQSVRPVVPEEDVDDQYGLSSEDAGRPQRIGSKMTRILMERIKSKNLVLPTMPQVAIACMQQLGGKHATFDRLAETLEQDPLLSSQVLRVANSVAFASTERALTLQQAIGRLGGRQLRTLLIELAAHQVFQSRERRIRDAFNGIWEHSLAVALLARGISRELRHGDPELAHLAGLLHDLGKPMVGGMLLEAERQLSRREQRFMTPGLWMQVVEDAHRPVGQAIAAAWKMPEAIALSIEQCGTLDTDNPLSLSNFVTVANALAKRSGYRMGTAILDGNDVLLAQGFDLLGIDNDGADRLLADLGDHVSERDEAQRPIAARAAR